MLSVTVIYDILRDGIGATPIVLTSLWLLAAAVGLWMIVRLRRRPRGPSRLALAVSLLWLGVGGFGFGNVLYQHFRCRAAAASGDVHVVQGEVTAYRPQDPHNREDQEILTVSGQTWTYSSGNLGRGGYRGVPSAGKRIGVGRRVRISSYDGRILKLELLEDRPRPAG
jgi:hypothetical protein